MRAISVLTSRSRMFDVQDKLHHVFAHAGDGREFVGHIGDANRRDRRAGQRGQQHTPQSIAQRRAVAALQRADHEAAILRRHGRAFDLRHD